MKFLIVLTIQFLIINSLAFGGCDQQYTNEIKKLSEGLKTLGNNQVSSQVRRRRDSLQLVRDVLTDITTNNQRGPATQRLSQEINVNPRTVQTIIKRANRYNRLCEGGVLLDSFEIGNLINSGKLL